MDQCTSPFDSLQIWRRTAEREKWRLAMWAWLLPLFPPCDVRSHRTHKFRILILFFVCFFLILSLLFHRCLPQSLSHFAQTECVRSYFKIHTHRLSAGYKRVPECVCVWILFPRCHDAHHWLVLGKETLSVKKLLIAFRSPAASNDGGDDGDT